MTPSGDYIRTMSRYNQWMNESLFRVCAEMPDAERKADVGASYRSIHGVLNHQLLGDRLWLSRFQKTTFAPASLSQELYADFDELWSERRKTDAEIERWAREMAALSEAELSAPLTFFSVALQREATLSLWHAIVHFFNHQTHHRGQLTTLLNQAGRDFGLVDLLWLPGVEQPKP